MASEILDFGLSFFKPISIKDYRSRDVDFYEERLALDSGIYVPSRDEEEEKEEEEKEEKRNINVNVVGIDDDDDEFDKDIWKQSFYDSPMNELITDEKIASLKLGTYGDSLSKLGYKDKSPFSVFGQDIYLAGVPKNKEEVKEGFEKFVSKEGLAKTTIKTGAKMLGVNPFVSGGATSLLFGKGLTDPLGNQTFRPSNFVFGGIHDINMSIQYDNVREIQNAIKSGSKTKGFVQYIDGQLVSRSPTGSQYSGTTDLTHEQLKRLDALNRGIIPSTFNLKTETGERGESITLKDGSKAVYDNYGRYHSRTGTSYYGSRSASIALAEKYGTNYKEIEKVLSEVRSSGKGNLYEILNTRFGGLSDFVGLKSSSKKGDIWGINRRRVSTVRDLPYYNVYMDTPMPSVRIKDRGIKGGGFDFKSGVMDKGPGGSYFFSETEGTDVYSEDEYDEKPDLSRVAEDDPARGSYESWVQSLQDDDDDDVDTGLGSADYSTAYGGQIGQGMQAGGPAGFIGGPPEKYGNQTTVADDIPLEVKEGTFVINAPAVEYAGSDDISKMLVKAYEKAGQGVDKSGQVTKIPSKEQVDIMISRGEVVVPPNIAKIIGYDRLEKINNRGKKEVARRQQRAGDQEKPQARQGFINKAGGDKITVYRGEPSKMPESAKLLRDRYTGSWFAPNKNFTRTYGEVAKSMEVTFDEYKKGAKKAFLKKNIAKERYSNKQSKIPQNLTKKQKSKIFQSLKYIDFMANEVKKGNRSAKDFADFMYEGVFPKQKNKATIMLLETAKRSPIAFGKLVAQSLIKNVVSKGTPIIGTIASFAPKEMGDATLDSRGFVDYNPNFPQ